MVGPKTLSLILIVSNLVFIFGRGHNTYYKRASHRNESPNNAPATTSTALFEGPHNMT